MRLVTCVHAMVLVGAFAAIASAQGGADPAAQDTAKDDADVVFKHPEGKAKVFDLDLNHGQTFVVRIKDTCPAAFDYSYVAVERARIDEQAEVKKDRLSDKDFILTYDQQFGGYVFHITQKAGAIPDDVCEGGKDLVPVTFIVSVRQQKWNLSFSGAFTVSGLTDPVFSLKTENDVKTVFEEPDKENTGKLGAASFVHLFHDNVQWKQLQPALGFGLGINDDNRAEYMVGAGLRFGDRATVNVGRVWGSVARLPNGVTFDTPITDDNVLNNLGTRVVSRWFFALSYSFIDTKDHLLKPFTPDTGQAVTTPEAESGQTASSAVADKASSAAIQAEAKTPSTYGTIPEINAILSPSGAAAREICEVTATEPADAAIALTVKVKGVSAEQIAQMQKKSGPAVTLIVEAAKKTLTAAEKRLTLAVSGLTFAACP